MPQERFHVFGVRTPGGGNGKGLYYSLTPQEKEGAVESANSSPFKVRRQLSPLIQGVGNKYEGSDSPQPSVTKLAKNIKKLRKENEELRIRDAERKVEIADHRNKFNVLSHSLCSKIKRASKEMGKEDCYYAN